MEQQHAHPELEAADAAQREPQDGGLDLLSIGLAVFFVALILTVAAMLVLSSVS